MPENSLPLSLRDLAASQEISAHAQIGRLLHEHLSEVIEQVEARVSEEMDKTRQAASEEFNQAMRRLRQCGSTEEVATWLVDSTAPYCGQAALFEVMGARVRGVRARGFQLAGVESVEELEAGLDQAPALRHAVLERDAVIAIGSPAEVSPQVVATLGHDPAQNVHLYPMVVEEKAVAILYAMAGARSVVDGAALEWLAQAAGAAVQILAPKDVAGARPSKPPELISIEGVDIRKRSSGVMRQALEARARWSARATVARLRISQRAALERGRLQRDIYGALQPQIDAARRGYTEDFLAVSPTIADYLHRELLSLAQDDATLLGPEYPGSLV